MAGFPGVGFPSVRTEGGGNGLGNSIGVFTWAALQAAYPNGGGALAALPAGVTATVTGAAQLPLTMTPNAAKTRWIPLNGVAPLWQYSGSFATPLWTLAGVAGSWSPPGGAMTHPAGLFAAGDHFTWNWTHDRLGTAGNINYGLYFGTTGTTADSLPIGSYADPSNPKIYAMGEVSAASSSRITGTNWNTPPNFNTGAGGISDFTTNINLAAAMTWSINVVSINVADTFYLVRSTILWRASA
jgi:hypothetical protein